MTFEPFRHHRVKAAAEVLAYHTHKPHDPTSKPPSDEYIRRRIMRDVSRRFGSPLCAGAVDEWPWEFVLQNYFEDLYEQLADRTDPEGAHDWQAELERLSETEDETRKRLELEAKDASETDDFAAEVAKEAAEQLRKYGPIRMPGKGEAGGMGGKVAEEARREVATWGSPPPGSISMKFLR